MARLTLDEARKIGTDAIQRVIGDSSLKIEFKLDFDRDEEAHYSFRVHFPTVEALAGSL